MKNSNARPALLKHVVMWLLVACLVFSVTAPAMADNANQAVMDCTTGVVQVNMVYTDPDSGASIKIAYGSGFLINETTVITNDHCVHFTTQEVHELAQFLGIKDKEFSERVSCSITVSRDVTIPVSINQSSAEMDFAILTLAQPLQNRSILTIRSSSEVKQTESVFALGFPGSDEDVQEVSYFNSSDVNVSGGSVNKVAYGLNFFTESNNYTYIQTNVVVNGGNSGGPLVDVNGYVVGIVEGGYDGYSYAVAIDQVTEICDALGIKYKTPADAAPVVETPAPTAEPTPAPTPEPTPVPTAEPTVEPTPVPAPVKEGPSMVMILTIAAAVVVIIIVVVVVLLSKKSKPAPAPAPVAPKTSGYTASTTSGFTAVNHTPAPSGSVGGDSGSTTVLNKDPGETTILSKKVNGGRLVRKRTGDTVQISTEEFTVGREKSKVSYCVNDSSISRVHAKLTVRGGVTYLQDMKSANGTYINGVKMIPNQDTALNNGDKISFAEEEFTFQI